MTDAGQNDPGRRMEKLEGMERAASSTIGSFDHKGHSALHLLVVVAASQMRRPSDGRQRRSDGWAPVPVPVCPDFPSGFPLHRVSM